MSWEGDLSAPIQRLPVTQISLIGPVGRVSAPPAAPSGTALCFWDRALRPSSGGLCPVKRMEDAVAPGPLAELGPGRRKAR